MHGRLKVKTSAQQQEEKRKEREKKLKIFNKATSLAFSKIGNEVYDDEGFEITKQILLANSDYSSLWNYRKRAFLSWMETNEEEKLAKMFKNELELIETCLRNNPKAYGCWHQRCFVMTHVKKPDWKSELHLCDMYLQFDDRNFHCWDYRRFVTSNANISNTDEIVFTNKLIETNFSNYSSWHYRSKLLPKVFPDKSDSKRIEESKLLEELELVQNAFFTDPNDQSAWFYHRWLLGRGEVNQCIISVIVNRAEKQVTCTLRIPVKDFNGLLSVNDQNMSCVWIPSTEDKYAHVWHCCVEEAFPKSDACKVAVQCNACTLVCSLDPEDEIATACADINRSTFQDSASNAKLSLLEEQLQSCNELNDLEPGNKWVMVTVVLLMRATGTLIYSEKCEQILRQLVDVDPQRRRYYADLRSKYVIEDAIASTELSERKFSCNGKGLTRLCHLEYLPTITHLDISGNSLQRLSADFSLLQCLKVLKAAENQIREVPGVKNVPTLEEINLDSNLLSDVQRLRVLSTCPKLRVVFLRDNPATRNVNESDFTRLFEEIKIEM